MTVGRDIAYSRWLLVITLCGALLRFWGVASQPLLADEVGAAFTAVNYMENGQIGPIMPHHPHLRDIVLFFVGTFAGYSPLSLRAFSLFSGILSIPLMAGIMRRLGSNHGTALLAALLLAMEQVHIVFSRQAIQETWTTFLFLLGVYLVLNYQKCGRKPHYLFLAGICFGAGTASKFHALFPLFACMLLCLWFSLRERVWMRAVFELVTLTVLPFTVYVLTFLPWFARGYGLADWVPMQRAILEMMVHHQGNPMDQIIDRQAWQWFLRPMVYGNFVMDGTTPHVTISWSNPLVWLLVIPATAFQAWHCLRERANPSSVVDRSVPLLLFGASYLPLATSSRPIWLLTSLAVIPFAFMILSRTLVEISESFTYGRRVLAVYLSAVVVVLLLAWPMAVGKGTHYGYLAPFVERYRSVMEVVPTDTGNER